MKIGVISDTHDRLETIDRVFEELAAAQVELVCHCGDWVAPGVMRIILEKCQGLGVGLKGVMGNNDGDIYRFMKHNEPEQDFELGQHTLEFTADKRSIVLYHGTEQVITDALIASGTYDVVMSGHTHEPRNASHLENETLALNPGTLSLYSPQRGRLQAGEYALYDTQQQTAELLTFAV